MEEIAKKTPQKQENSSKNDKIFAKNVQNLNEEQVVKNSTFASQSTLEGEKRTEKMPDIAKNNKETADVMEKNTQKAVDFVKNLFKIAKIDAEIELKDDERAKIIEITSNDSKYLIGPHGETMNALQVLVNNFITPGSKLSKKLLIDVDNYREKQLELLKNKTKGAIEKCLQTAKPVSMDYMNAYERFVVHEIIMQDGRVLSESFGKEPRRFVKIFIK